MMDLYDALSSDLGQRLGWTLLHSVWQTALIAGLLALLFRLAGPASSVARHRLACGALAVACLLPVQTFLSLTPDARPVVAAPRPELASPPPAASPADLPEPPTSSPPARPSPWRFSAAMLSPLVPGITGIWLAGLCAWLLWTLRGWITIASLRRGALPVSDVSLVERSRRLGERMALPGEVELLASCAVDVPTLVGYWHPVVLLPDRMVAGFPEEHIDAVLAHEFAHLRRRDHLVNLAQAIAESVLFFHPAVHWISTRLRIEREHCCDDEAALLCGGVTTYARALVGLEETRIAAPALAASGGDLLRRVQRLTRPDGASPSADRRRWSVTVAALWLTAIVGLASAHLVGVVTPPVVRADVSADAPIELCCRDNPELAVQLSELRHRSAAVRAKAASTLGLLGDSRVIPQLIRALEDNSPVVREQAAEALDELEDRRAVPSLIRALDDRDPEVRREAAEALDEIRDRRAVDALIDAVHDEHAGVREEAVEALGQLGDPRALPTVLGRFGDADAAVRANAAAATTAFRNPDAIDPLVGLLQDPDVKVRLTAMAALGTIRDARATPHLLPHLSATNPQLRQGAAMALGMLRAAEARRPLIAAMRDESPRVRASAARALCLITGEGVAPVLAGALHDEHPFVREEAAAGLGLLRATAALPQLIRLATDDEDFRVRDRAVWALAQIGDPDAASTLAYRALEHGPATRDRVVASLKSPLLDDYPAASNWARAVLGLLSAASTPI